MRGKPEDKLVYGKKEFGYQGELKARQFLEKKGFKLVKRNYSTRWGEIDLIFWDGNALVFVEVKHRRGHQFGEPEEAVNHYKQKHLIRAALQFIQQNGFDDRAVRFDVVSLGKYEIKHFRNAFQASGDYYF